MTPPLQVMIIADLVVDDVRATSVGPKLRERLESLGAHASTTVVDDIVAAAVALAARHPTGPGTVRVLADNGRGGRSWGDTRTRCLVQILMARPAAPLPDPRVLQGAMKTRALAKIALAKKKPPVGKPHRSGALVVVGRSSGKDN
jgi:hypothetical protein